MLFHQTSEKHAKAIFIQKKAGPHGPYDVIFSNFNKLFSPNVAKMCLRDMHTATENGR